jgi:hypothetical protein
MMKTRADYQRIAAEGPNRMVSFEDNQFGPEPVIRGLEATIHRVQYIRESLVKTGLELNDLTDRVLGVQPTNASAGSAGRTEPNGQLEALNFHLDLLDACSSDLARMVIRLREGL